MTTPATPSRVPEPGHWVTIELPNGRRAKVTTAYRNGQRYALVRPL